jgi:hypothetical protein
MIEVQVLMQILRRVGSAHAIARGGNGKLAKTFDYCEECRSFSAVETSLERLPGTACIRVYAIAFLCCRRLQPSSLSIPYRLHTAHLQTTAHVPPLKLEIIKPDYAYLREWP